MSHRKNEPRNTRNTRNPEAGRFSFRVFRVLRGSCFGCGFAAPRWNSRDCSQAAMKSSRCKSDEFVSVRLARCQECRQDTAAIVGDLPAVGAANLGDEAVGVQQGQSARELGCSGALLLRAAAITDFQFSVFNLQLAFSGARRRELRSARRLWLRLHHFCIVPASLSSSCFSQSSLHQRLPPFPLSPWCNSRNNRQSPLLSHVECPDLGVPSSFILHPSDREKTFSTRIESRIFDGEAKHEDSTRFNGSLGRGLIERERRWGSRHFQGPAPGSTSM